MGFHGMYTECYQVIVCMMLSYSFILCCIYILVYLVVYVYVFSCVFVLCVLVVFMLLSYYSHYSVRMYVDVCVHVFNMCFVVMDLYLLRCVFINVMFVVMRHWYCMYSQCMLYVFFVQLFNDCCIYVTTCIIVLVMFIYYVDRLI